MAVRRVTGPFTLQLSTPAQDDIVQILAWTQVAFGEVGRARYENLITTALIDLRDDPGRAGERQRDDIGPGICTYHLASSRKRQPCKAIWLNIVLISS